MKKILLGIMLSFVFTLSSCISVDMVDDHYEFPHYDMSINDDFETVYFVGAEEPDFSEGVHLYIDGIGAELGKSYIDTSSIDMNVIGVQQVRYYYNDMETREEANIYLSIIIIDRESYIKRFDVTSDDGFSDFIELDDGYLCYGTTKSIYNGNINSLITRLDSDFNVLWYQSIGTNSDEYIEGIDIVDDLYYVSIKKDVMGEDFSTTLVYDAQFLIINDTGSILYNTTYSRTGFDVLPSFTVTSDGGIISVGTYIGTYVEDPLYKDKNFGWIIKYDSHLNIIFDRLYEISEWNYFTGVLERTDGNYLVWGDIKVSDYGSEAYMAIINDDGDIVSSITFEDYFDSSLAIIEEVIEDDLGNIFVFGNLNYNGFNVIDDLSSPDAFIAKFDSDFNLIDTFIIDTENIDILKSVSMIENGNFLITGVNSETDYEDYTLFILELDSDLFEVNYVITDYNMRDIRNVVELSDSKIVVTVNDFSGITWTIHHLLFDEDYLMIGDKTFSNNDVGKIIETNDGTYMFLSTYAKGEAEFDLAAINGVDGIVIEFSFE